MARFTVKQFLRAIPGSGGIVNTIAQRVGCDWHTARRWIDSHPKLRHACAAEREAALDLAESKLLEAISNGEAWAIKYFLSTQGKQRGYVERQELTGVDGPLTIQVVLHGTGDGASAAPSPWTDAGGE